VVVFDNLAALHAIVLADPREADAFDSAQARLDELFEQLRQPPRQLLIYQPLNDAPSQPAGFAQL
jgi:anthranilate synthase component 1